jgi:hypothetical protein
MALPSGLGWLALRTALLAASVLMQEVNFVIFAPVVALDVWLALRLQHRFAAILTAAVPIIVTSGLTFYLVDHKTACDTPAATAYFQHMAADFEVLWRPVRTLCNDSANNRDIVRLFLWDDPMKVLLVPVALIASLPTTILNIVLASRALKGSWFGLIACIVAAFGACVPTHYCRRCRSLHHLDANIIAAGFALRHAAP